MRRAVTVTVPVRKTMPFDYLDHTADVCLRGRGKSISEAFCEAARALFNLMVDLEEFSPIHSKEVSLSAERLDLLLVAWLAELLAEKDLSGTYFSRFQIVVSQEKDRSHLVGRALGETLSPGRHRTKVEVKGITYSGLEVSECGGEWIAQCVVDI